MSLDCLFWYKWYQFLCIWFSSCYVCCTRPDTRRQFKVYASSWVLFPIQINILEAPAMGSHFHQTSLLKIQISSAKSRKIFFSSYLYRNVKIPKVAVSECEAWQRHNDTLTLCLGFNQKLSWQQTGRYNKRKTDGANIFRAGKSFTNKMERFILACKRQTTRAWFG